MEAEPVPVPGLSLHLPAQVPGNFQALQAACELSVLSKSITPAGKQILIKKTYFKSKKNTFLNLPAPVPQWLVH